MHTIKPIISTVHLRTDPANVQCVWLVNNCPQTVWPMFTCSLPYIPVACGVIQYSGKRSWYWASPKRSPWTRNSLLPTAPTCSLMRSLWLISPSSPFVSSYSMIEGKWSISGHHSNLKVSWSISISLTSAWSIFEV